ncbi:MAG: hypothetical protein U5K37_13135 [Natrialbaceae archaeon]|nr:hypothetical protein [Natrialbaceae archaeon]
MIYTEELDAIDFADSLEFEVEFLIDDLAGTADLRTGTANVDLEMRLLIGGTVTADVISVPFGSRGGDMDCQLTAAWGGNVSDPQLDDPDQQIGAYRHDPLELSLTSGSSGNATGRPYDGTNGTATLAEGQVTAGRLSEGQYGLSDPGGSFLRRNWLWRGHWYRFGHQRHAGTSLREG